MTGLMVGEPSDERAAVLAGLLHVMPGNGSEIQRPRLLTAMQQMGSVTSYKGSRFLECYDPLARICERRLAGYRIETIMRAMPTESGVHHVGVYVLEGTASSPLFDALDDEVSA